MCDTGRDAGCDTPPSAVLRQRHKGGGSLPSLPFPLARFGSAGLGRKTRTSPSTVTWSRIAISRSFQRPAPPCRAGWPLVVSPHTPTQEAHGPDGRGPDGECDGRGSRGPGGRCIRHAPVATPRALGSLAVPVIEPAFHATTGAARSRAAVGAVARSRGSDPHSRPGPGSRTHRGRTPSRTPSRGTAPCATARLWRSRRPAAPSAQGEGATRRDVGDRPNGVGGRRRASRWAAITRARLQTPARSQEIETLETSSCRCDNLDGRVR